MMEGRLYNTGKHMWRYNQPAAYDYGRVTHRLLGPCPRCGFPTTEYGGGFSCNNRYCPNSSQRFVSHTPDKWPKWWDEEIFVKLDGSAWCACGEDFENLQESDAGFGNTPSEAVLEYKKALAA